MSLRGLIDRRPPRTCVYPGSGEVSLLDNKTRHTIIDGDRRSRRTAAARVDASQGRGVPTDQETALLDALMPPSSNWAL